ncbi:T-cell receptor gamma chain V region PT-gamma-1/2 [Sinocyclocheilus anshuiensis]|uniref:T-cell receptor gamma chain V region PT-gamma-1/2 n=1 Tax=Sinocyclocheilus anshuiensis TaxID=1608454 RepID=UPI003D69314F
MDLHISCNIKLFSLLYLALHCFLWKTSLNVSVQQGQNVTLSCPLMINSSKGVLSWYKQTPWHGPQLILSYNITNTSRVRRGTGLDHSRYTVLTREGLNLRHLLQILTTLQNDTGTYYCGFSDKNQTHMFDN